MSKMNLELFALCHKYNYIDGVVIGETMADFMGWTSVHGKIWYCADKDYEVEKFMWFGKSQWNGNSPLKTQGKLRFADWLETFHSLLVYDISQWGYTALCTAIRYMPEENDWWNLVKQENLEEVLWNKLETAIELGEDDNSILELVKFKVNYPPLNAFGV